MILDTLSRLLLSQVPGQWLKAFDTIHKITRWRVWVPAIWLFINHLDVSPFYLNRPSQSLACVLSLWHRSVNNHFQEIQMSPQTFSQSVASTKTNTAVRVVGGLALSFAKFGVLWLDGGNLNGTQIIPKVWVDESTQPLRREHYSVYYNDYFKAMLRRGYYNYMWWRMAREDGSYDFIAEGNEGQFIYVSPRTTWSLSVMESRTASLHMIGSRCFMSLPVNTKWICFYILPTLKKPTFDH